MAAFLNSLVIPSNIHSFDTNGSPRGADMEERLDLSLDALIKERRTLHRQLNKEAKIMKEFPARKKTLKQKLPHQQQKQHALVVINGQKAQRKAVLNKNRGLPMLSADFKKSVLMTKMSSAATTTNLHLQLRADRAKNSFSSRQVISLNGMKVAIKNIAPPLSMKKKNARLQKRKVTSSARAKQPKRGQKLQQATAKAQTKTLGRQVVRTSIDKLKNNRIVSGRNNVTKQKVRTTKCLPGKLFQNSAKKNVGRRTKSRSMTAARTILR